MTDQPISVRGVLLLLLEAERYPRLSNHDWVIADAMEAKALELAAAAVPSPADPPEFTRWLATVQQPNLDGDERVAVYEAMIGFFEPEAENAG